MTYTYEQAGKNKAFPEKITTWKLGEPVPEWLSDIAKVDFIDGQENITLKTRETNSGGLEIVAADGKSGLIILDSKSDMIAIGDNEQILSLSPRQLELLYRPI